MNPEMPQKPQDELEARLTALLLGELPHDQAAALHQKLAQDAELAKLYERLKQTVNLVRETIASPAAQTADQPTPLKLSDQRRQKLLQHFKTVTPKAFAKPRRPAMRWLVPLSAAAALVALMVATLVPNFIKARSTSMNHSFGTWSLSQSIAPAPAAPDKPQSLTVERRLRFRRPSQSATPQAAPWQTAKVEPPAALVSEPAPLPPAANTFIVLPRSNEVADAPTTPPVLEGANSWSASAASRGFYVGGGAYGGYSSGFGGSAGSDVSAVEARQKELAATDSFFTQSEVKAPSASPNTTLAWQDGAHNKQGDVALLNGSMEGFNRSQSQEALKNSPFVTRYAYVVPPVVTANGTVEPVAPAGSRDKANSTWKTFDGSDKPPVVYNDTGAVTLYSAQLPAVASAEAASVNKLAEGTDAWQTQGTGKAAGVLMADGRGRAPSVQANDIKNAGNLVFNSDTARPDNAGRLADTTVSRSESVRSFDLQNADPQDVYNNLQELFQRGNARQQNNKQSAALGANDPLTDRLQNNPPLDVVAKSVTPIPPAAPVSPEEAKSKDVLTSGLRSSPSGGFHGGIFLGPPAPEPAPSGEGQEVAQRLFRLRSPKEGGISGGSGGAAAAPALSGPQEVAVTRELALRRGESLPSPPKPAEARPSELGRTAPSDTDGLSTEAAGQVLGMEPPEVKLGAKFAEVGKNDQKALGYDWYLGNELKDKDAIKAQAGTAPSEPAGDTAAVTYRSAVAAGNVNLNYPLRPAAGGQPGSAISGGDKVPLLGDVPAVGHLFRSTPKVAEGDGKANAGSSTAPQVATQGAAEAVLDVPTVEAMTDLTVVPAPAPATPSAATISGEADKSAEWNLGTGKANVGSLGRTYPNSTTIGDAYFSTDPEKHRLVYIADEDTAKYVGQVLTNLAPAKGEAGRPEIAGANIYGLNVVGYANVQQTNAVALAPTELARRARSPIALPSTDAGMKLALNDSNGKDEKTRGGGVAANEPVFGVGESFMVRKAGGTANAWVRNFTVGDVASLSSDGEKPAAPKPAAPAPIPQPEVQTAENAFSTFSLNVSDVAFKLAAASLEKGVMPEPATVRSEEFINAFDYRDPEAPPGVPVAFAWERAQYPFAQNRDLLRFSVKTAAQGRQPGRALNLVLLLDNSGSMERADRVQIIHEALRVLAGQLQPQDMLSVVTFARTAHLWVDGVPGSQAAQVAEEVSGLTPQGGTNLEDAMNLAYQTALRHYLANGVNRVVLLTDGAANLGNVDPEALKQKVEANRKQGIALDCFGIGWEGYNDDLLEVLTRNGDGRYAFLNSPEEVADEFAAKLAGALQVAASDVKVQVEFNPARVTAYRQIGYAKHQLTKEQFRDNTVNAAQIGAAEAGNALYTVEVNPAGTGPLCTVRVRFRIPGTADYREHAWDVPFTGNAVALEQASPAMRLAATGSALSEWLVSSPYAGEVTPDRLLGYLSGVPEVYGADARPKKLEWMIRQAKSIAGK